jgi:prepilin-type N-terminal cleavage/methylation domain-containing protein
MVTNRRGVTLIELMLVVVIIGLIVMLGPTIMTQTAKFFILGQTKLQLQAEARAAMYIITRELRQAQSSTITITQVSNQPYYSKISFVKIEGSTVTVSQSGSNLTLTEGTDSSVLSKNLSYLAFTFPESDDMTIISVSMTLQEEIYGGALKALHMASEQIRVMD